MRALAILIPAVAVAVLAAWPFWDQSGREGGAAPIRATREAPVRASLEARPPQRRATQSFPLEDNGGEQSEIVGRVVGADRSPLSSATLELTALDGSSFPCAWREKVREDGTFQYDVALSRIGGCRCGLMVLAPDVRGRWLALPDLRPGTRVVLGEIRLSESGLAIAGRVSPHPEGAWVTVRAWPERVPSDEAEPDPAGSAEATRAAESGAFQVGGLRPGMHQVEVNVNGRTKVVEHIEAGRRDVLVDVDPAWLVFDDPGKDVLVRVVGPPPGACPSFRQVPGVVLGRDPRWGYARYDELEAEARGDAWLVHHVDRELPLILALRGFATAVTHSGASDPAVVEVRLSPGTSLRGRILSAGVPTRARVTLEYLLGPDGRAAWPGEDPRPPIHPECLRICREHPDPAGTDEGEDSESATSYRFDGLPTGRGWLTVHVARESHRGSRFGACSEPYVTVPGRLVDLGKEEEFDLEVSAPITARLEVRFAGVIPVDPQVAVSVKVRRAAPDEAWFDEERDAQGVSSEDGTRSFSVQNLLVGTRYEVLAYASTGSLGYFGRLASVVVDPSGQFPALTLEETPPLRGTVRDHSGSPCPRARVSIQPGSTSSPWADELARYAGKETYADVQGRFELLLPPLGVVLVSARSETGTLESPALSTTSSAQAVNLTVARRAEASGRVLAAAGTAVPWLYVVRVLAEDGSGRGSAATFEDGFFRVDWPDVGPVRLVLEPVWQSWGQDIPNECLVSRPVTGSVADLRLQLEPGSIRSGVVCDARGTPIPDVRVHARGRWTDREQVTDGAGRWRMAGLCDPELEVTATGRDGQQVHGRTNGDQELRLALPSR